MYNNQLILADVHTHIYDCFDLDKFFDAAVQNFAAIAYECEKSEKFLPILFLTETQSDHYFEFLYQMAQQGGGSIPGWMVNLTGESCSVCVTSATGQQMLLIAGSQIVVEENLEVLALATSERIPDGLPLQKVINKVNDNGGLPVIPWGFGKWIGRRGKILEALLQSNEFPTLFLGDNAGRPSFWKNSPYFKQAVAKQIKILPGTDPLPFASETNRAGRFGFWTHGSLDPQYPAKHLKQILLDPSTQLQAYGALENPLRFVRNQIAMQIVKRTRKKI